MHFSLMLVTVPYCVKCVYETLSIVEVRCNL